MNEEKLLDPHSMWNKLYPILSVEDPDDDKVTHYIYINTYFETPDTFSEVLALLDTALATDVVIFKINSGGGILDSVLMLVDAVRACKAEVICELTGSVGSAATMLALACSDMYVAPHTTFMIHNFSGGIVGKGHEIFANSDFLKIVTREFMEDFYRPFLTQKELNKVIDGKDIYLGTNEVYERFEKVKKKRLKALDKERLVLEQEQHIALKDMVEAMGFNLTPKEAE